MIGIRQEDSRMASVSSGAPRLFFFVSNGNDLSTLPSSEARRSSIDNDDDEKDTLESLPRDTEEASEIGDEAVEKKSGYGENYPAANGGTTTPVALVENEAPCSELQGTHILSSDGTRLATMRFHESPRISGGIGNEMNNVGACSSPESKSDGLFLSLLEDCKQNNPVSALTQYYQSKGFIDLKACFREVECHVVGKNSSYWRYEFTCPVNGTVFQSSLPTPLLVHDPDETMMRASKKAFGDYEIMDNGKVSFSTKKGAKRSVAFAALHTLSDDSTSSFAVSRKSRTRQRRFPDWVMELAQLGIRPCDLTITYEDEVCDWTSTGWTSSPTQLCCILQIEGPNKCTIRGSSQPTKQQALKAVVCEAKHRLTRENVTVSSVSDANDDSDVSERLLACDSATDANYTVTVPPWANASLPDGTETDSIFHLYKLEFESLSGEPFVAQRSGIDESAAGPLGIAFPKDIQPPQLDIAYETRDFYVNRKGGTGVERVVVRLCTSKRETLTLNANHISWVIEFNRIQTSWKEYGRMLPNRTKRPLSLARPMDNEMSPSDRTYLFVPLTEEGEIDWTLLRRIAARDCTSCISISCWIFVGSGIAAILFLLFLAYNSLTGELPAVDRRLPFAAWELCCCVLAVLIALHYAATTKLAVSSEGLANHILFHKGTGELFLTHKDMDDAGSWRPFSPANVYCTPCKPMLSHSVNDFLLKDDTKYEAVQHISTYKLAILPFPRHYLYLARHNATFMPLVEREIELVSASLHMLSLSNSTPIQDSIAVVSLSSLLREATTLTPKPTYQRLEFLGDAVLGCFVTFTIMSRNSSLKLTYDDIETCLSGSTNNSILCDAALRIGANQLLFCSQRERKWRSRYSGKKFLNRLMRSTRVAIYDSIMSDAVESLLGATFMHDINSSTRAGSVSAALFDRLHLPICSEDWSSKQIDILSSCLHSGYPFETDVAWRQQISSLRESLLADQEDAKQLERNLESFIRNLVCLSGQDWLSGTFENEISSFIFFAALFHDDSAEAEIEAAYTNGICSRADSDSHQYKNTSTETTIGPMLRLSRFREMIFMVGAYALQLCVTTELFQRYPDASEGELHTLRARAVADDIVVYIMFKAGIQDSVYKMEPEIIEDFERKIAEADYHGLELWGTQGGWLLPGGTDEYARRRRMSLSPTPQYPGCAGGRLSGMTKKLDLKYTEQPMFVMKAIIGALVLSHGLERMWKCIGPLFEEVLLLSPEESLRILKDSNVK